MAVRQTLRPDFLATPLMLDVDPGLILKLGGSVNVTSARVPLRVRNLVGARADPARMAVLVEGL